MLKHTGIILQSTVDKYKYKNFELYSRNRFSSLFHQRSTPSVNQETTSPPDNRAHSKRHAFSSSRSSNEQTNDNDDETDCIDGEIEGVEMIGKKL